MHHRVWAGHMSSLRFFWGFSCYLFAWWCYLASVFGIWLGICYQYLVFGLCVVVIHHWVWARHVSSLSSFQLWPDFYWYLAQYLVFGLAIVVFGLGSVAIHHRVWGGHVPSLSSYRLWPDGRKIQLPFMNFLSPSLALASSSSSKPNSTSKLTSSTKLSLLRLDWNAWIQKCAKWLLGKSYYRSTCNE